MAQKVVRICSDKYKTVVICGTIFFGGAVVGMVMEFSLDMSPIIWAIVSLSGLIGVLISCRKVEMMVIVFYNNRIAFGAPNYEDTSECKYSHFQIVSLKLGNILLLQTESRKTVAKADLSYGWSISKINRILLEFKKHNKKIEIDERLQGIYNVEDSESGSE